MAVTSMPRGSPDEILEQEKKNIFKNAIWGTWVAQAIEYRILGLSSGLDLWVMSASPARSSIPGVEPA